MTPEELDEIRNFLPTKELIWTGKVPEPQRSIASLMWRLVDELTRINEVLKEKEPKSVTQQVADERHMRDGPNREPEDDDDGC